MRPRSGRSRALGHVPIIDVNPRRDACLKEELAEEDKRRALVGLAPPRISATRAQRRRTVNANLKDNHGGRTVQVRGPAKVICHLMFGILVITVSQIIRLIA